jgi:hypothetical protein
MVFLRVKRSAPPMSRRAVTKRRELLLPPLIAERHPRAVVWDCSVPISPLAAIEGKVGERPGVWARHSTHYQAVEQASPRAEVARPQLLAGNHLLARLIFQRVRPHTHSGGIGGQARSPDQTQQAHAQIALPDIPASLIAGAEVPVAAPVPPAIETLFTQLARRRLPSRPAKETHR